MRLHSFEEDAALQKAISKNREDRFSDCEDQTIAEKENVIDAEAADGLGTACTRVDDRVFAAFGICDDARKTSFGQTIKGLLLEFVSYSPL